jgi:hypothetical protein
MLDTGGDEVALLRIRFENTVDGGIVAFGAARGEDDFIRRTVEQGRDLVSSVFEGFPTCPPKECMLDALA